MRVLLALGTSTGGVGRHVHDLATGLVGAGDQVEVVAPAPVLDLFGFERLGVATHVLDVADRPHPRRDAAAVRALSALAACSDVVHAHGVRVGALAAVPPRRRVPLVVTLHNAPPPGALGAAVHGMLERLVARGADLVLGVSSDLVSSIAARGARRAELAVVPAAVAPVVHTDRFAVRSALGVGGATALLVTVARLAPQKDLGLLLDAISRLRATQHLDLVAVVAGEGPLRASLESRIAREHLPVHLVGHRQDVADLLAAADVVISSARWEGQPVALQEAMHLGAAIVATDAGGTSDVVGDAAILVPVGDAQSLASAVADVLRHGGVRDDLRSKAMHRAGELPTHQDAIVAAQAAYRSVQQR